MPLEQSAHSGAPAYAYVPFGQDFAHSIADPEVTPVRPAGQAMHGVALLLSSSNLPAAHGVHCVDLARENVPAFEQVKQFVEPVALLYLPAGHGAQAVALLLSSSNLPAAHDVHCVDPAGAYVPAFEQVEQFTAPVALLYLPARHGAQVVPVLATS